ncbi:hypothetical protein [Vibrio parahaemolyticus]|uniref:hypothetical protein n=1 Tax=Vibrio parahaemolyticus TaxID=670 RepID=UPI001C562430|nr:hypothetical protein [Vibrio parahaemolyticus]
MIQVERWQKIEAELMAAYALLPETTIESDNGYRKIEFLITLPQMKLLLAMEELDGVIEDNPIPSKQFWNHLIQAANMMGHSHADRYKSIRSVAT